MGAPKATETPAAEAADNTYKRTKVRGFLQSVICFKHEQQNLSIAISLFYVSAKDTHT